MKLAGKYSNTTIVLAILLTSAISFILYQNKDRIFGSQNTIFPKVVNNTARSYSNESKLFKKIDTLLSNLSNDKNIYEIQEKFLSFLANMKNEDWPSLESYEKYIQSKKIPTDLKYYFTTCISKYISNPPYQFKKIVSKNIIFSIDKDSILTVDIDFNLDNLNTEEFGDPHLRNGNKVLFTGTYTSPLSIPTGLAINGEKIINPFIQDWDGLLIINKRNKISFQNIHTLSYDNTNYNIAENLNDYKEFLEVAQKENLKIIQTHMLVSNDSIIVVDNGSKGKARRRAIFETSDNGLHIYDSFDTKLTLYELAKYISDNFHPINALNLDMGDFNFYREFKNGTIVNDLSSFSNERFISNMVSITY